MPSSRFALQILFVVAFSAYYAAVHGDKIDITGSDVAETESGDVKENELPSCMQTDLELCLAKEADFVLKQDSELSCEDLKAKMDPIVKCHELNSCCSMLPAMWTDVSSAKDCGIELLGCLEGDKSADDDNAKEDDDIDGKTCKSLIDSKEPDYEAFKAAYLRENQDLHLGESGVSESSVTSPDDDTVDGKDNSWTSPGQVSGDGNLAPKPPTGPTQSNEDKDADVPNTPPKNETLTTEGGSDSEKQSEDVEEKEELSDGEESEREATSGFKLPSGITAGEVCTPCGRAALAVLLAEEQAPAILEPTPDPDQTPLLPPATVSSEEHGPGEEKDDEQGSGEEPADGEEKDDGAKEEAETPRRKADQDADGTANDADCTQEECGEKTASGGDTEAPDATVSSILEEINRFCQDHAENLGIAEVSAPNEEDDTNATTTKPSEEEEDSKSEHADVAEEGEEEEEEEEAEEFRVRLTASMAVSLEDFSSDKQALYVTAVANALSVPRENVAIVSISAISLGRRRLLLQTEGIQVETEVLIPPGKEFARMKKDALTLAVNAELRQLEGTEGMEVAITELVEVEDDDTQDSAAPASASLSSLALLLPLLVSALPARR